MKFKNYIYELIIPQFMLFFNKKKGKINIILTCGEILIIIIAYFIFSKLNISNATAYSKNEQVVLADLSSDNKEIDIDRCKYLYNKNKEVLIFVNKDHEVPEEYNVNLKTLLNGREKVSDVLYDDLVDMLRDAKESGEYTYWIASGYRSKERQQGLIDNQISMYITHGENKEQAEKHTYQTLSKSGYSEHQTGLAIDFLSSDNLHMDVSQENTQGNKWLRENSYKYGFILRYPKGKEDITYINYEPWHFRYVGKETAQFIHDNNITFEEFYEYANN